MADYKNILQVCLDNSKLSEEVIDNHLLEYADRKNHLSREFNKRVEKYKHITRKFQASWVNMLRAQYMAHRIFKTGGLINKYLNHSEIRDMESRKQNYVQFQAGHPWCFRFSVIMENPEQDFYTMLDIFRGDTFLLYSPSTSKILEQEQNVTSFFNLTGYNGSCWQSYGPVAYYQSFTPDDIFFFATERNPLIETDEDLLDDVEKDPVPYMMLLSGTTLPQTFHKNDRVVQTITELEQDPFDTEVLKKDFDTAYNDSVYKLALKTWESFPHFAIAFYDEKEEVLLITAMTDRGYEALTHTLKQYGFAIPEDPEIRVTPAMLSTAGDILKKNIELNPYEKLFKVDASPAEKEDVDKINKLMGVILPDLNAGKEPDIQVAAEQAGLDVETARDLVEQIKNKFGEM